MRANSPKQRYPALRYVRLECFAPLVLCTVGTGTIMCRHLDHCQAINSVNANLLMIQTVGI